jgi:transposase
VADNFWLTDEQFAALAPHLPMVHTGPERQDDRRIISGITHRFCEGCRWRGLPEEYGRIRRSSIGTTVGAGAVFGSVCSPLWSNAPILRRSP